MQGRCAYRVRDRDRGRDCLLKLFFRTFVSSALGGRSADRKYGNWKAQAEPTRSSRYAGISMSIASVETVAPRFNFTWMLSGVTGGRGMGGMHGFSGARMGGWSGARMGGWGGAHMGGWSGHRAMAVAGPGRMGVVGPGRFAGPG